MKKTILLGAVLASAIEAQAMPMGGAQGQGMMAAPMTQGTLQPGQGLLCPPAIGATAEPQQPIFMQHGQVVQVQCGTPASAPMQQNSGQGVVPEGAPLNVNTGMQGSHGGQMNQGGQGVVPEGAPLNVNGGGQANMGISG